MGVKISALVEKKNLAWEQLKGKRLAVDASNMLFQFLSSIRQTDGTPLMDDEGNVTSHLAGLFSRVPNLLLKGITPIFVFDGEPPALKTKTLQLRRAAKEKARERYTEAVLKEDQRLAGVYARQFSYASDKMFDESKDLLQALGLPVIQAPSEAEAQCAYMAKKGVVWASASQDYDSLLFGASRLVLNLTLSQTRKVAGGKIVYISPYLVEIEQVLRALDLTQEQLIILGILCGTDYNPGGVPGIGPKKALKLLHSGKKVDEMFDDLHVTFDWKEIQSVFQNMPTTDVRLRFPSFSPEKVREILVEKHSFSTERVESTLTKLGRAKGTGEGLGKWLQ